MSEQEQKKEKVVFSWQVFQEEDGSFRTEMHASPDWEESFGCGPFMHGGPWGFRFGMHPLPMKFHRARRARHGRGRDRARHMLDWLEQMYDDFYGDAAEEHEQDEA